ncbi:MAG: hypothetical protein M1838_002223 [Thelocarpon superellum]|nr:MAG: hypothetical protein M1838_002223 [Thelocarpon superellum]
MAPTSFKLPVIYRLFLLTIEPIATLIPLVTQVILTQLANLYFCLALNEALVLRCTSDLRVWRTLWLGLLIADFGHRYRVHSPGSTVYWNVLHWSPMDWGNIGFVYGGALMRICFLSGLGLPTMSVRPHSQYTVNTTCSDAEGDVSKILT